MDNKKRSFSWIIGLIILAVIIGVAFAVFKFKQSDKKVADYIVPKISFQQMQLTNLTPERADVKMRMIIDNPGPIGFKIDSLFYIVSIADQEVARTTYPDTLR